MSVIRLGNTVLTSAEGENQNLILRNKKKKREFYIYTCLIHNCLIRTLNGLAIISLNYAVDT